MREFKLTVSRGGGRLAAFTNAFTLAEVLVTLGIIGVVSAMTIPTLIQNHQRKVFVTQLHKVYNEFQQAAVQYMTDRNALNLKEAGLTTNESADAWIKKYFKVIQDCSDNPEACFAINEYKYMNGNSIEIFGNGVNQYIISDGTAVYVTADGDGRVNVWVDLNGKKGPNIIGRDVFATKLYNNGVMDDSPCDDNITTAPLTEEQREAAFQDYCMSGSDGCWWGCFGKILNDNWEMNY